MKARPILGALLLTLALPNAAAAKLTPIIPPGNSGVNQYVENMPTASGGRPTTVVSRRGSSSAALSANTRAALNAAGSDGAHLVAVTNATAPPQAKARASRRHEGASSPLGGSAGGPAGPPAPSLGSGGIGSVVSALTGTNTSGGMGAGLIVALITVPLVFVAIVATRRRRTE